MTAWLKLKYANAREWEKYVTAIFYMTIILLQNAREENNVQYIDI